MLEGNELVLTESVKNGKFIVQKAQKKRRVGIAALDRHRVGLDLLGRSLLGRLVMALVRPMREHEAAVAIATFDERFFAHVIVHDRMTQRATAAITFHAS